MPDKSTHLTLRCLDCPRRLSVPFYDLSQGRDHLAAALFGALEDGPWLLRVSMPPAVGVLRKRSPVDTAPALGPVCNGCARKYYTSEEIEAAHAKLKKYIAKRAR